MRRKCKLVAEEIGYSRPTIYQWKRLYDKKGAAAFMKYQDIPRGKLEESSNSTSEEIAQLKAQMRKMQLKIDVLEETIKVIKKDRGVDLKTLKNREMATIIDALNSEYSLPELFKIIGIAKSSYYYLKKSRTDKYSDLRIKIRETFEKNIRVSEKVIRRLMKEKNLVVKIKRTRKYNSYKGEITPAVENIVVRDFHAEKPNEKWLSDLTEFSIPAGKVCLSPIVD